MPRIYLPRLTVAEGALQLPGRADGGDGGVARRRWAGTTAERLSPHALPGGYPNLLTADEPGRVAQAYGLNAARLTAAKEAYDPGNVFTATPLPGATSA